MNALLVILFVASARFDGIDAVIGDRLEAGGEAVSVIFRVYEASIGPMRGAAVSGVAVSRLPSDWYKVTITIRAWDVYPERGNLHERGKAIIVLDRPRPGRRERFRALLWSPHYKKRTLEPFAKAKPIYTVTTTFERVDPVTEKENP